MQRRYGNMRLTFEMLERLFGFSKGTHIETVTCDQHRHIINLHISSEQEYGSPSTFDRAEGSTSLDVTLDTELVVEHMREFVSQWDEQQKEKSEKE